MEFDWETLKNLGVQKPAKFTGKQSSTSGIIVVRTRSTSEQWLRGLSVFVIGLIVTAFSIFIPLLHFILVPLLLICTLIATGMAIGAKEIIIAGLGPCPHCGKDFRVFQRGFSNDFSDHCEACSHQATITIQD